MMEDLSSKFNVFNLFDPIDEQGIVPEQWKVPQPMSGLTIYEPVAFMQGVKNQLEMDMAHAEWALPNLCLEAGCEIEKLKQRQSATLIIVLLINIVMFFGEFVAGLLL